LSDVNNRLSESIKNSEIDDKIKKMLKLLLNIELRNFNDNNSRYSEDYDKIINDLSLKEE
jgi:hypothetical protein